MKSLKVQIPEGFEVDNFNQNTGELTFKKKLPPRIERISTFEEVCEEMGVNPIDYSIYEEDTHGKALQIYSRLMLIAECFQEGASLNLHDTDQAKWYPWFEVTSSGFRFSRSIVTITGTTAVLGPLLQFPSKKISDYVGQTFIAEYQRLAELKN